MLARTTFHPILESRSLAVHHSCPSTASTRRTSQGALRQTPLHGWSLSAALGLTILLSMFLAEWKLSLAEPPLDGVLCEAKVTSVSVPEAGLLCFPEEAQISTLTFHAHAHTHTAHDYV